LKTLNLSSRSLFTCSSTPTPSCSLWTSVCSLIGGLWSSEAAILSSRLCFSSLDKWLKLERSSLKTLNLSSRSLFTCSSTPTPSCSLWTSVCSLIGGLWSSEAAILSSRLCFSSFTKCFERLFCTLNSPWCRAAFSSLYCSLVGGLFFWFKLTSWFDFHRPPSGLLLFDLRGLDDFFLSFFSVACWRLTGGTMPHAGTQGCNFCFVFFSCVFCGNPAVLTTPPVVFLVVSRAPTYFRTAFKSFNGIPLDWRSTPFNSTSVACTFLLLRKKSTGLSWRRSSGSPSPLPSSSAASSILAL